jgi:hypothetical protein
VVEEKFGKLPLIKLRKDEDKIEVDLRELNCQAGSVHRLASFISTERTLINPV